MLPAAAALIAFALAVHEGLAPACNPFLDGCVSISRAARHGLPNHVFRALVLPAAVLQALAWLLQARRWPRPRAATMRGSAAVLAVLGVAAGIALVLYGSFLGTEGATYRWLRRYGIVVYFGGTCLAMLVLGRALQRLHALGALHLPRGHERALLALFGAIVLLGLGNTLGRPVGRRRAAGPHRERHRVVGFARADAGLRDAGRPVAALGPARRARPAPSDCVNRPRDRPDRQSPDGGRSRLHRELECRPHVARARARSRVARRWPRRRSTSAPAARGSNAAIACARQGARTAVIARVGSDEFGAMALRLWRDEGIDASQVEQAPGERSGVAQILVYDDGDNSIAVAPGAGAGLGAAQVRRRARPSPRPAS